MFAAELGWHTLQEDWRQFTDFGEMTLVATRLLLAAFLGGMLGYGRQRAGKAAGLRTHMMVALGAAFFVLTPQLIRDIDLGRVIGGVVAGIGFLGAGAILKVEDEHRVEGLTTAASIWLSAAVGIAVGIGRVADGVVCTVLAVLILEVLWRFDPERVRKTGKQ